MRAILLLLLLALGGASSAASLEAFPGALGWGRHATGWRGGAIVKVTNTNDTGPGSLRDCLELHFPRVCIFEVGGTIEVNQPLEVRLNLEGDGGKVYIAGQSAPEDSGGIQIRLAATNASAPTLQVMAASDVLIRHIRLRPGPGQVSGASVSGFQCRNCNHVMLDNVSIMYATDQNFSINTDAFSFQSVTRATSRYITLQDSIVAYGLHAANHSSGNHSKGALICNISSGDFAAGDRCGYVSVIRNYFAHNNDRNPEIQSNGDPFEVINNLIYNHASDGIELVESNASSDFNIISNAMYEGSDSVDSPAPTMLECTDNNANTTDVYLFGNIDEDNRPASNAGAETSVIDGTLTCPTLSVPAEGITGAIIRAEELDDVLLPIVGATAPVRDALDALVVGHCCPGNAGARVNDPTDVTGTGITDGYPTLAAGTAPTDTDDDGMPDDWERATTSEFWVTRFNAWGDRDSDGWSNLEEYLNVRAGDIPDPTE